MQGFLLSLPHLHWPSGGFGSRCCWASRCRIQSDVAPGPSGRGRLTETPAPPAASTTPRQPARTRSGAGWPRCGWTSRPGPGPGPSLCRVSSPRTKNSERLKWRGGEFSRRSAGQWYDRDIINNQATPPLPTTSAWANCFLKASLCCFIFQSLFNFNYLQATERLWVRLALTQRPLADLSGHQRAGTQQKWNYKNNIATSCLATR